jgi:hypothetical protein
MHAFAALDGAAMLAGMSIVFPHNLGTVTRSQL